MNFFSFIYSLTPFVFTVILNWRIHASASSIAVPLKWRGDRLYLLPFRSPLRLRLYVTTIGVFKGFALIVEPPDANNVSGTVTPADPVTITSVSGLGNSVLVGVTGRIPRTSYGGNPGNALYFHPNFAVILD